MELSFDMLLIIGLSKQTGEFPMEALRKTDGVLVPLGFKREISTVVKSGREYAITYDGPMIGKGQVGELLEPLAHQYQLKISIDVEESVKFP